MVGVGKGVVGAIKIVLGFFCRVCGTGLPGVGLVVAMTSLMVVFDGWLWEVDLLCLYPSWVVYFVSPVCWPDTRASVYESRGWYCSRCTAG